MPADTDFQRRLASIATLLAKIEAAADPSVRSSAKELVQVLMDLNGAGFERALELVNESSEGQRIIDRLGRDDLVSSLLVLYGIHPLDLETRVRQAVQKLTTVELVSIQDGSVRLRTKPNAHGCGVQESVEEAIYAAAPDVTAIVVDAALIPLEMLRAARPVSESSPVK